MNDSGPMGLSPISQAFPTEHHIQGVRLIILPAVVDDLFLQLLSRVAEHLIHARARYILRAAGAEWLPGNSAATRLMVVASCNNHRGL